MFNFATLEHASFIANVTQNRLFTVGYIFTRDAKSCFYVYADYFVILLSYSMCYDALLNAAVQNV